MKFIHLSDLHLGKRVNEYSMLEDQEYILKKIINVVDAEKPNGGIIAGDIYDKSVPAAEAADQTKARGIRYQRKPRFSGKDCFWFSHYGCQRYSYVTGL